MADTATRHSKRQKQYQSLVYDSSERATEDVDYTGYDNNFLSHLPWQVDEFSTCPSGKTSCPCQILNKGL